MIYDKKKLLMMGGTRADPIKKWSRLTPTGTQAPGTTGAGRDAAR